MEELNVIEYQNGTAALAAAVSKKLAAYETARKQIEDEEKAIKKAILAAMEKAGVSSLKTDEVTISYIAPTTRESVDTKAIRQDFADSEAIMDLLDKYTVVTPVAASVRIRVNG